jgi:hypothetical protein
MLGKIVLSKSLVARPVTRSGVRLKKLDGCIKEILKNWIMWVPTGRVH